MKTRLTRTGITLRALLAGLVLISPQLVLAQASPFMTGATALQTNILAWLTPVAVILVMVLGAMAMANRMLKSLAARIVFAPKDFPDAREISDELGFTTVPSKTVSTPVGAALHRRGRQSRSQSVSLQRRALLLPQEVKELGSERCIVFYEGLRPIRCKKIRYFRDKRFRRRLFPAPSGPTPCRGVSASLPVTPGDSAVASPPPSDPSVGDGSTPGVEKEAVVIRDATVEDVERIESLTLEDFACDFSKVEIPSRDGPVSEPEMKATVDTFLNSLERA